MSLFGAWPKFVRNWFEDYYDEIGINFINKDTFGTLDVPSAPVELNNISDIGKENVGFEADFVKTEDETT